MSVLSPSLYIQIYIYMYVCIQSTGSVTPNFEPHSSSHSDNTPDDAAIVNSKLSCGESRVCLYRDPASESRRLDAGGGVGQIGK